MGAEWDGFSVTPDEIVGADETVIALGRYRGVCRTTGVGVDAQFVHVWRLSDRKVVRFQQYTDTAQSRDAAAKARQAEA